MLLLDFQKIKGNEEEVKNFVMNVLARVDIEGFLQQFKILIETVEKTNKNTVEDEFQETNILISHVLQLSQFWLLFKEDFRIIDKIIDRSENLPMKFIEEK